MYCYYLLPLGACDRILEDVLMPPVYFRGLV